MEDEVNLLDYWRIILKRKKTIAVMVFLVTLFSVFYSLSLPDIYKAEATIMPVGGGGGGAFPTMAGSIAKLSGLFGGGSSSSTTQLMVLLKSRTLTERMIDKYDLRKVLYPKLWDGQNQKWVTNNSGEIPTVEDAADTLSSIASFTENQKTQLIEIDIEMEDAKTASEIANNYVKELDVFINENALTAAKRNRLFIETQLERNKADLLKLGKELSGFYALKNISNVMPTVDVDITVETWTDTRKNEKTLGVSDAFADIQKKTEELQKKVGEVESQIQKAKIVEDIPQQVYLQYLSLRREILGHVNSLLTQQYEMAKIEESREDLNFQVIDWARVPKKRFKPKRSQIVMTTFAISLFLAVFYAFFREYLEKIRVQRS